VRASLAAGTALLTTVLVAQSAAAQERTLQGVGGASVVFVWKDKKSHNEGLTLIQAGVHKSNPMLVMRLLACMVPSGTKAVITSAGFATHDVLVTSGEFSGCRGNVAVETTR
jgi:hypothetical protein